MAPIDLPSRISARAVAAAISVESSLVEALSVYLQVLARWNRRINLTAFDMDELSDAAIDRLIVEPLRASKFVRPDDAVGVDIGSGGGSPAFPLKLASPHLRMVLVESRLRKAAFLREVGRTLGVEVEVEACRFEEFAGRPGNAGRFDVVSVRAVRVEGGLWGEVGRVLSVRGRVLWFTDVGHSPEHLVSIERDRSLMVLRSRSESEVS